MCNDMFLFNSISSPYVFTVTRALARAHNKLPMSVVGARVNFRAPAYLATGRSLSRRQTCFGGYVESIQVSSSLNF